MKITVNSLFLVVTAFLLIFSTPAMSKADDFRPFILKAITKIRETRQLGGYDIKRAFTQDLDYGNKSSVIKATRELIKDPGPNPTMCVAGVAEIIIEALNIYASEQNDYSFMDHLPVSSWTGGNMKTIRANLFMYSGTGSLGTAFALEKLGLGKQKKFSELKPGDFINLNRTSNTGHAVVFLGYIKSATHNDDEVYSSDVIGFKYFSAQGKGRPDAGFSDRNAYFSGYCPQPRGKNDDCNIIKAFKDDTKDHITKQNMALLNTGEMFSPKAWTVEVALKKMENQISRGFEQDGLTRGGGLEEATRRALEAELVPDESKYDDGSNF